MPKFSDIIGQDHIKELLTRAVREDNPAPAYIIQGERYSGKEFIASAFASALLCTEEGEEPCGKCHSCTRIAAGTHPDLTRITHQKPATISVDDVREQILGNIHIKPYDGRYRIYIINEAEKLNIPAQNALLKTLEEPPAYVVILLLTTNTGVFLPTIMSRCIELNMRPVQDELIRAYLRDNMEVSAQKLDICTAFAGGNLGKARILAKSEDFEEIRQEVIYLLKNIRKAGPEEMTTAIKKAVAYKLDIADYFDIMAIWFRDVLLFKATNDANSIIFKDELSAIRDMAESCDYAGVEGIIEGLDNAKKRLASNVNFELTLELLMLKIRDACR